MQNIQLFKDFMGQTRKVVIVTHHKPDADALGSSLGLSGYLKKKGHAVTVVTPSDYPEFLHWMPGNSEVLALEKANGSVISEKINKAEIIFCLDFSALNRIQDLTEVVRNAPGKR
jgi:phosphoesterase RecJ-like protein